MALAYVTEHLSLLRSAEGHIMQIPGDYGTDQAAAVNFGSGAAQSAAFNSTTRFVGISVDSACSMLFGANPTATTSNRRLPANFFGYFPVTGGHKVSFISNT